MPPEMNWSQLGEALRRELLLRHVDIDRVALELLGRDRDARELRQRRHGRPVVGGLAEQRADVDAPARVAIPQNGIHVRIGMRAAGIGAVVAQHADVAPDRGAQIVRALERPAPSLAEEFRLVPPRLRRFGPVALGPAAPFGEIVLEQAGIFAQRRIDRDGHLDRLGADRDLRLGLGFGLGFGVGDRRDGDDDRIGASRRQQVVMVIPVYSAACACPSRLLSAFSNPSAACAITVPGGKIASTPARLSAS